MALERLAPWVLQGGRSRVIRLAKLGEQFVASASSGIDRWSRDGRACVALSMEKTWYHRGGVACRETPWP